MIMQVLSWMFRNTVANMFMYKAVDATCQALQYMWQHQHMIGKVI